MEGKAFDFPYLLKRRITTGISYEATLGGEVERPKGPRFEPSSAPVKSRDYPFLDNPFFGFG
jgi:hypothetical protein